MTPDQAKRQAVINESMAILYQQQADLDRERGMPHLAQIAEDSAADHRRWQQDAERIACSTQ
jgi:hypothetical protein